MPAALVSVPSAALAAGIGCAVAATDAATSTAKTSECAAPNIEVSLWEGANYPGEQHPSPYSAVYCDRERV
jgi:hypothetical protein